MKKELNDLKANWYALFICLNSNCTVDKALSKMGLKQRRKRGEKNENHTFQR
ncbi:hypothetical protein SAMN02745883_00724 [Caminicella sporogenes DSM 14501]|uniref:Uncharacterized protein n=1 Tax=Caminicella sporogenes DSM 14501 TaxID=1121266 RepID=A0A1M6MZG1_9FIRM|nr:hypothetical protein [Caminicella sporogenes]SHJ88887.1 hypothetical protein SAMN02745883_00724 [Caminicella sporogenes DSM 14501]